MKKHIARGALIFTAAIFLGALGVTVAHAGDRPIGDPVSLKAKDVRPLIAEDITTYMDGGESALGWTMHVTTAAKLQDAFLANEVAATRQYGDGADIIVSSTVRSVSVTINKPTVNLAAGPYRQVPAVMKAGHEDWLATLKPAQRVQVVCRRARQAIGMVGVFDCEPRAAYVARMTDVYFFSMAGMAKQGDKMAARLYRIASGG